MALRLGGLCDHCLLCCRFRTNGRRLPYFLPCHQPCLFRHLGFTMAHIEPGRYGLYMVWCPSLDWRRMCLYHAQSDCAKYREYSQRHGRFRNGYQIVHVFLFVLAIVPSRDLVSCLQDSTSFHGEVLDSPDCRRSFHGMGHSQSRRNRSDRSSRLHHQRKHKGVGRYCNINELYFQLCHLDCQRS